MFVILLEKFFVFFFGLLYRIKVIFVVEMRIFVFLVS